MIRRTEVDGIPAVVAPATGGPVRAGLVFRVGQADETLPRSGITHLIEHLVLHPLGHGDYHHNGSTAAAFTSFHVQGSEQEVARFLTAVCDSLAAPPLARLEAEKGVLRTEAATHGTGVLGSLAVWRHGAHDYGLPGMPEWGLHAITADDVRRWTARFFTRDNAVLWVTGGDVPGGLRLRLPSGVREPMPTPSSALPVTPASYGGAADAVAWDSVVAESDAAAVFSDALERVMYRELRHDSGLSYTVRTEYSPRGDGGAVITALADALPEKQDAVLGGFAQVLRAVRAGRIEPGDVTGAVARRLEALRHPGVDAARLPWFAREVLTGRPLRTTDELAAGLAAVTVADVVACGQAAERTGLLMTPPHAHGGAATGVYPAVETSPAPVAGVSYRARAGHAETILAGPEGISAVGRSGSATVRLDACAAVLSWPDGRRLFVGLDATSVTLEPTLYRNGADAVRALDDHVPPHLRVPMPARDPRSIPQPRRATVAPQRRRQLLVAALWALLALACFAGGVLVLSGPLDDDARQGGVGGLLVGGFFVYMAVRAVRRNRL
ncbi:hypothetical protein Aab01nite_65840 [Paractinoplanes abujensis]|nr:hypothetical protein Aab01nite_65840 [Actinoplanes abujensis]